MDYEAMSASELQQECARLGLPSARAAKATMVQRLRDHDSQTDDAGDDFTDVPAVEETAGPTGPAAAEQATEAPAPQQEARAPSVFRMDFPAEDGGPDEETHLAYRHATVQAAIDAGRTPRGDARLAAVVDGRWVYEVSVRQVT